MANDTLPVVLVTGASRGIGRGIALELAKKGYSVAINYAGNQAAAEETRAACSRIGTGTFAIFQANIGVAADRARMVEEVWNHFGTIDALVNNAGVGPKERRDITEATEQSFHEVMDVNLAGPYFLTQAVVQRWLGLESGTTAPGTTAPGTTAPGTTPPRTIPPPCRIPAGRSVVFVGSISATTASVQRGEYCLSKAGVAMAAQLWAARLAAEKIAVFEVRPGIMETDMTSKVKAKYDVLIAEGLVPQMRWGTPEDVGRLVRAMVDGDLAFSTGSVVYSDGGFHISRL